MVSLRFHFFSNIKGSEKHDSPVRPCDTHGPGWALKKQYILFASHAAMVGKNVKEATRRAGEKVLLNRVLHICTFDGLGLLHI